MVLFGAVGVQYPGSTEAELISYFSRLDVDGDGGLSRMEFQGQAAQAAKILSNPFEAGAVCCLRWSCQVEA